VHALREGVGPPDETDRLVACLEEPLAELISALDRAVTGDRFARRRRSSSKKNSAFASLLAP